jgi:outer membrane protein TolC
MSAGSANVRWLLALTFACLPATAGATRYTLERLLAKVRTDYPAVAAARAGLEGADAQVAQADRLWWPSGDLTFGITGSPHIRCIGPGVDNKVVDPDEKVREANCVQTNTVDLQKGNDIAQILPVFGVALRFDAKLLQPIYTSGKIGAARDAAHAGRDAARYAVEVAKADVSLQAVRAYWGLKWARAAGATLSDGRKRIKEWVDTVDRDLERGKSGYTETDLIRIKLALEVVDLSLLDVRRAERIALAGLHTLTGEPDADVDEAELDPVELAEQPLSYYEDAARTHRPEARMLDAARVAAHAGTALRLAEMLPDLGLLTTFNYSYMSDADNPNNAFMNHPNSLGASLLLVMRTQLDIPERLAKHRQARADERALEAKRREALGGIALEIERAYADAEEARKRADETNHGEKLARGWYNAVDQNLQLGTAEARDLVDAARSYFELRLKHLQSIMDMNIAVAALRRASGVE